MVTVDWSAANDELMQERAERYAPRWPGNERPTDPNQFETDEEWITNGGTIVRGEQ